MRRIPSNGFQTSTPAPFKHLASENPPAPTNCPVPPKSAAETHGDPQPAGPGAARAISGNSWRLPAIRLPPPRIGRLLIAAFCLAFLAGALGGCDDHFLTAADIRSAMSDCRRACAPFATAAVEANGGHCYCADRLADGGHP